MAGALEDPATLDQPVQDVMDAPFPVVDADLPVERLTTMLSRETPAALVRRGGKIAGIGTPYDPPPPLARIQGCGSGGSRGARRRGAPPRSPARRRTWKPAAVVAHPTPA